MSTMCMVLNVEWVSVKKSGSDGLLVQIGEKLIASQALLKGAVLKYGLVKVYGAVTSLNTSNHYAIFK